MQVNKKAEMGTCSAVIVTYNSEAVIRKCIQSIKNQVDAIIVVDNNSSDKTIKKLNGYENLTLIEQKTNLGYAQAVNRGIQVASFLRSKYMIIMNPDIIAEPGSIETMRKFIDRNKDSGIVGPAVKHAKRSGKGFMYDLGGKINWLIGRSRHVNVETIKGNRPLSRDYVSGCFMVIKAAALTKIGKFDERFFMYYEDDDICTRMKQKGYTVYNLPSARVYHVEAASSGWMSPSTTFYLTKSALQFGEKWLKTPQRTLNILWLIGQSIVFAKENINCGISAADAIQKHLLQNNDHGPAAK